MPHTFYYGCQYASVFECKSCKSDYYYNKNDIHDLDLASPLDVRLLLEMHFNLKIADNKSLTVCYKGNIQHCAEYFNGSICSRCDQGYYTFDDGHSCKKNPYLAISECETYQDFDTCLRCTNGFHLASSSDPSIKTGCVQSQTVENCDIYSQSSDACERCQKSFMLSGKSCQSRTNYPIEQCDTYEEADDRCKACASGFEMSTDGLLCGPIVDKCAEYELVEGGRRLAASGARLLQAKRLECKRCEPGHYLTANSCPLQNISECKVYVESENKCKECNDNWYADQTGNCQVQKLDNCVKYVINENTCSECAVKFYLSQGVCEPINVPNCESNAVNENKCAQCSLDYRFVSTNDPTCSTKNTEKMPPNCTLNDSLESNKCTKCTLSNQLPYKLMSLCLPKSTGCEVMDSASNQCKQCKPGYSGANDKTCSTAGTINI